MKLWKLLKISQKVRLQTIKNILLGENFWITLIIIRVLKNEITKDTSLIKLEKKSKQNEKKQQSLKTKLKMKKHDELISKYRDSDQKIILMRMREPLS